jgi:hypothetical protein
VDLTQVGKLIIQLNSLRLIEVDAHQVDVNDPWSVSFTPGTWEALGWFAE